MGYTISVDIVEGYVEEGLDRDRFTVVLTSKINTYGQLKKIQPIHICTERPLIGQTKDLSLRK